MIPYGKQDITQADIDAVVDVLRSDFLTQGATVPRFENVIADYVGCKYGVAVNSGTSALHIACLALGLGTGDTLWTSPNTFVASANCALYCGAGVDFVDIDSDTWNMNVDALREKLILARKAGCLPKIVVPVHFAGQPTDQEEIWKLSKEFNFHVLEDASHSIGASRNGERVGNCKWSDITILSFHPVKNITTGEGGMVLTNNKKIASRIKLFRSHGITRDENEILNEPTGPWYYEQQELGFNYRLTDIQASLGISQLSRLNRFIEKRNSLAVKYSQQLIKLPLKLPVIKSGNKSAFHLYVIRLMPEKIKYSHREVFEFLRKQGIAVNLHYMPVHLQPYYKKLGFRSGMFPESELYGKEAITLPMYPNLAESEQLKVIDELTTILT